MYKYRFDQLKKHTQNNKGGRNKFFYLNWLRIRNVMFNVYYITIYNR